MTSDCPLHQVLAQAAEARLRRVNAEAERAAEEAAAEAERARRDAEAQAQAAELRLASALASEAAEREAADARRQHDAKRLAAVEHELSTARTELRAARDATMQAEMRERAAQAEAEGTQGVRLSRLQAELADALALADRRQLALATALSDADEAIAERRRAIAAKEESDERLRLRDARSKQALDEALGAAEHTHKMQASAHADEVQGLHRRHAAELDEARAAMERAVAAARAEAERRVEAAALDALRQRGDDSHAAIEEVRATAAERSRLVEERMRMQATDERMKLVEAHKRELRAIQEAAARQIASAGAEVRKVKEGLEAERREGAGREARAAERAAALTASEVEVRAERRRSGLLQVGAARQRARMSELSAEHAAKLERAMVEVESAGALAENARRAVDRRLLSLGGMAAETITPVRPAAGGERGASGMMSPYVPHVPYIESPSAGGALAPARAAPATPGGAAMAMFETELSKLRQEVYQAGAAAAREASAARHALAQVTADVEARIEAALSAAAAEADAELARMDAEAEARLATATAAAATAAAAREQQAAEVRLSEERADDL